MSKYARLLRLVNILRLPAPQTTQALANALGVSERTIYRDIQDLITVANLPVYHDRGYQMKSEGHLPVLNLSLAEGLVLYLVFQPFVKNKKHTLNLVASDLFAKIQSLLPGNIVLQVQSLLQAIEWLPRSHRPEITQELAQAKAAKPSAPVNQKILEKLLHVLLRKKPVTIAYCTTPGFQSSVQNVTFVPHHIRLKRSAGVIYGDLLPARSGSEQQKILTSGGDSPPELSLPTISHLNQEQTVQEKYVALELTRIMDIKVRYPDGSRLEQDEPDL